MSLPKPPEEEEWKNKIYSGGWKDGSGGIYHIVEPATGETIGSVGVANAQDVDAAVKLAKDAQPAWASTPFNQRANVCRKALALLQERANEFDYWNQRETGSVKAKCDAEIQFCIDGINSSTSLAGLPNGQIYPSAKPGQTNVVKRVPIGVVCVIAPFNFPMYLALRSFLPALVVGNAVVLKPDIRAAVVGGLLFAKLLADAGLPPNLFHVLPGNGDEAGKALVEHPDVKMISFTGSSAVGRSIGETCGRMLKKCALELGGNNVMIICGDADLDAAASNGAFGAFLHQGQICMQLGRILVHESVYDVYVEKITQRAKQLVWGNPYPNAMVHLGPLINQAQKDKVTAIVEESVSKGATMTVGGPAEGLFFQPTVLSNVKPDMPAFEKEIFGPVAPVTTFSTDEEAIELANRSEYGLVAAIHCKDMSRAQKIADQLKAGMIHINDQTVKCEPHVPFGGTGASGSSARFGGPMDLETFTESKWISAQAAAHMYPF